MRPFPNLISDSLLIDDTIELLRSHGGRTSAVNVLNKVMKISGPEPNLAKMLVAALVETDPRLNLNDDVVELISLGSDSRDLFETDFVVFDLETTGAKAPPCRVTEIGAFRIRKGEITDGFHTLVNPETPIPAFISQLTGISDAMVENAPKFREVADSFLEFIADSVLVAHNARFDMRFLNYEIGKIYQDYRVANPFLCTVKLARRLVPNIPNHRLNTVADHFSIALENHHRASDDARATAHIFVNLLGKLGELGVKDLATARSSGF